MTGPVDSPRSSFYSAHSKRVGIATDLGYLAYEPSAIVGSGTTAVALQQEYHGALERLNLLRLARTARQRETRFQSSP